MTARRSTCVMHDGIPIFMRVDLNSWWREITFEMKYLIIFSVLSMSDMTPSRIGRIALMLPGVL